MPIPRPTRILPILLLLAPAACGSPQPRPSPEPPEVTTVAHVHSIEDALASFRLPEGYRVEVVAYEPMVQDPVAIDFDADGRMYVVEMRGYMPDISGENEDRRNGRIVVLEDTNWDGLMDRRTVFMDSLVLPRAVKVLEHGVLVAATPYLWLARDLDGDLRADSIELIRDDYGSTRSNPEHNANGLLWGIDNWIKNANYAGEFRLRPDGTFEFRKTPAQGQWGVSMDDYGRLYRNSNEDPLRADLIPAHYATRNPDQGSIAGVYHRLTPNVPVWPARPTPAVNRGYRDRTLRPDSTLAHYTSAGSPTAYVGDRLPEELRNTVFVTESAGNLVGRFVVEEGEDGFPVARRDRPEADFMTSTDQRFRPVNLATAPDGTLYVVDMYRGIIQHRVYITGYLEDQIRARHMEQPTGLGRIYRIVHESTKRDKRPRLSRRTPPQLVDYLGHPNGWWRITAQRLIVERNDSSVAPALRARVRSAVDDRERLHALWTLDGLGAADRATVVTALGDESPHVRAAAVRIAEPWLRQGDAAATAAVMRLMEDSTFLVRRQVAASLGELPTDRRENVLFQVATRAGNDPVVADLVVSALAGREVEFLERLASAAHSETAARTMRSLAATIARKRDPEELQRVLSLATEADEPRWQQVALLEGIRPEGGRGRGGAATKLPAPPRALQALTESSDQELRELATAVAASLTWPGKPQPEAPPVRELTPDEQRLFVLGGQIYSAQCAACHQPDGEGMEGVAKRLVGSRWALSSPNQVIRILLHGKEGEMLMPPLGASMSDEEVAAVLTYVRRSWGNTGSPISPDQVSEARGESGNRSRAWTEEELEEMGR